jgi:hypothetical protein
MKDWLSPPGAAKQPPHIKENAADLVRLQGKFAMDLRLCGNRAQPARSRPAARLGFSSACGYRMLTSTLVICRHSDFGAKRPPALSEVPHEDING